MENIENEIDNAKQYNDFINTLDEVGLHNLDNAMEAMEVDLGIGKRKRYGEGTVKNEGERERPARAAGKWPPDREEFSYNYIPGQYRHMGTKRRDFEKPVKFQNQRSDGAILNLAAHDPIDWPNIISIWKCLIVQKYIQNQHNIGSKVEDMITYLETFLGESAKVLWEQWVEKNPNNYEELKRAGSNPHNFANVISNIIIAEDPELCYTTLQNERLKEIEKLTLTSWKGIKEFSQHYLYNATTAKQGYNRGIVERYFNKLPDPLGSMIFEEYKKETEGAEINISQAITFVFKQLRKICTGIQAQRSMKHSDYNFCNKIVQIPLSYGEDKPRIRLPFKEILGIRIPVKVKLTPKVSYKILALVDTGCTKNIIHDKYFTRCPEIVHTIDDNKAEVSTDMSGIKKIHNQLAYNMEVYINATKYIIDEITIRDLSMINDDMIIGLRFLQQSVQTTVIHEQGITFIPYQNNVPYISEVRKRGGARIKPDNLEALNLESEERINEYELSENIDIYYISNSNIECIGLQAFAPNWYRDIKSKKDIEKIVQRLEDIQIIGEIPMKYWEKNAIECKINIINPEYIIKTSPIEATPKDIEEFKMHIEELLKLGAIRESRSPHRSAAFIVRNHAEEVRGKSRMVINYKRLNDNTIEDAYNIPNKQEWINRIQGSKYFSKFDLKAGFWQVKMAEESIEWTAFTCPQGH
uniref:Retrotransposon protein, putative, Ty3-gypsy sub-class n=2 Tax=Oryza sativa subsp. japonica TaxID=39947 RepID=Q2R7A6_ORYSJ|nr:retrotransposon protein, putative, Ty3-gypsy sub-class [Oryza sativa Japonica Group]ABA92685.1 retrotransposon protein, putative, Ty3-gypsy subclass [Oryza sativa Japonica Group]